MTNPFDDEEALFYVLTNDEGQYSIWPDYLAIPVGWSRTGPHADRKTCMNWIDETWTDMRPMSLQRAMAADRKRDIEEPSS